MTPAGSGLRAQGSARQRDFLAAAGTARRQHALIKRHASPGGRLAQLHDDFTRNTDTDAVHGIFNSRIYGFWVAMRRSCASEQASSCFFHVLPFHVLASQGNYPVPAIRRVSRLVLFDIAVAIYVLQIQHDFVGKSRGFKPVDFVTDAEWA